MRVLSFTLLLSLILTLPLFASNSVSGTWTVDDSPVVIEEDSYVPVGDQLTVEAGVLVWFMEGTRLEVYGQIEVIGEPKNPVVFTGYEDGTVWDGLFLYGTDEGLPNSFTYAHILNCVYGLSVDAGIAYLDQVTVKADYYGMLMMHNAYARVTDSIMNVTTTNPDAITVFALESQFDALRSTFELNIQQTTSNPPTAAIKLRLAQETTIDSCHVRATSRSGAHGINLLACYDNVDIQHSSIHVVHSGGLAEQSCAAIFASDSDLYVLDHMSIHLEADAGSIYGIYAKFSSRINLINSIISATNVVSGTQRYASYIDPNGFHGSVNFSYSLVHQVTLHNETEYFTYDEFSLLTDQDPLWVDADQEDYHLRAESPCIDAGSPATEPDPDDTVADLGRNFFYIVDVVEPSTPVVREFTLGSAYPNPFNASTRFSVELAVTSQLDVRVQNVLGQTVATLADGSYHAGRHEFTWQTAQSGNLASGIYLLHVRANGNVQTQRLVLLK